MNRQAILLALALALLAGAGHAQQRGQSRDDLLDALTRHIQICTEITASRALARMNARLKSGWAIDSVEQTKRVPTWQPAAPTSR